MALEQPTTKSIVCPERQPDETQEQYRMRRKLVNRATDRYLRGTGEFKFGVDRHGKRKPYVKPKAAPEGTDASAGLAPEGDERDGDRGGAEGARA